MNECIVEINESVGDRELQLLLLVLSPTCRRVWLASVCVVMLIQGGCLAIACQPPNLLASHYFARTSSRTLESQSRPANRKPNKEKTTSREG